MKTQASSVSIEASDPAWAVSPDGFLRRLAAYVGPVSGAGAIALLITYETTHLTGFFFGQKVYAVDDYDEGVYMATAALMAHGYRLFSQIYSAQPPLFPTVLSMAYRALGTGVGETRVTVLLFGVLTLVATALLARLIAGWQAAGLTALLLAVSPEFLTYAHAVEEEVPVMGLTAASLAVAIVWLRTRAAMDLGEARARASLGALALAVASGVLLALAVLTKFFAFAALLPLAVILVLAGVDTLERPSSPRRGVGRSDRASPRERLTGLVNGARSVLIDTAGWLVGFFVPVGISFLIFGPDEWQQMVSDRVAAAAHPQIVEPASTSFNVHLILRFAGTDVGLVSLAVLGGLALLILDWRAGLILDGWGLVTLAMLARYHPLMGHHPVILLAPAAVLGGVGLSILFPRPRGSTGSPALARPSPEHDSPVGLSTALSRASPSVRRVARMLIGGGTIIYIALIPRLIDSYPSLLVTRPSAYVRARAMAAQLARAQSTPRALIAAGDAWICVEAGRLCVPDLVDTSYVRVETGRLTGAQAIAAVHAYRPRLIVLGRALCYGFGSSGMASFVMWTRVHYRLLRLMPSLQGGCGAIYTSANYGSAGRFSHQARHSIAPGRE